MELFNFTVKDAHACTQRERKKRPFGLTDGRIGCREMGVQWCVRTHTHRERRNRAQCIMVIGKDEIR
jgi:hypothetical protein